MSEVKVHLDHFEGPLALLLFLIRKEDMDILDINIVEITKQYLSYVKNMRTLDLEGAGDFIAMAATLIQIKSRMLMPPEAQEEEDEDLEDPRKELVDKLLEYKRYQELSKQMYDRALLGRDVWTKGYREKGVKRPDDVVKVDDNPLYALITHYRKALKKVNKVVHRVGAKIQSIASRVLEVKDFLASKNKSSLKNLTEIQSDFTVDYSSRLLITFLSLLELSKMGLTSLFQSQNYADIHVRVTGNLEGDVVSQVEDYENLNEELQQDLFTSKIEVEPQEVFKDLDSEDLPSEDLAAGSAEEVSFEEDSFLDQEDIASDEEIEEAEAELAEELQAKVQEESLAEAELDGEQGVQRLATEETDYEESDYDEPVEPLFDGEL